VEKDEMRSRRAGERRRRARGGAVLKRKGGVKEGRGQGGRGGWKVPGVRPPQAWSMPGLDGKERTTCYKDAPTTVPRNWVDMYAHQPTSCGFEHYTTVNRRG
jgi:hypothetical protein